VLQGIIVFLKGCAKLGKRAESRKLKAKGWKQESLFL
jgi:hypothetical protein